MAEAFLALAGELSGLRTLVVVKRILPHLSANEQFVRMFLDEARIGALLGHPAIPRIIEVGGDEAGYFLAMEAVPGKPLSSILRQALRCQRPLGQAHAAFIVGRAAAALGYAHALTDADGHPLNIVHRDVSPENILVSFEGAVKVIDFGIASSHGNISQTHVGGLKGKVQYMSPEQAAGAPVDRRSDVFSLGIVLWEALSGRRLFRRETDLAVMRAISNEPIPRPSGPQPIPAPLERIVMTALEREPERSIPGRARDGASARAARVQDGRLRSSRPGRAGQASLPRRSRRLEGDGRFGPSDPRRRPRTTPDHRRAAGAHRRQHPHRRADSCVAQAAAGRGGDAGAGIPRGAVVGAGVRWTAAAAVAAHGLGGAHPDPGSDSGEVPSVPGDDAAAYAALRAWSSRKSRRARPAWLLVAGAVVAAGVFAGLRFRQAELRTPPPPPIVDTRGKAAAEPPVVEALESLADPASALPAAPPTTEATPAIAPAESAVTPPPIERPLRREKPLVVRKSARVQRAAAPPKPAKPAAASKAAAASKPAKPAEPPPRRAPAARPAWRDPFQ